MKESDVLKAICDYLTLRRHSLSEAITSPVYDTIGKRFRSLPKYTMKGVPDIILIKNGQYIGLEVKREKRGGVGASKGVSIELRESGRSLSRCKRNRRNNRIRTMSD